MSSRRTGPRRRDVSPAVSRHGGRCWITALLAAAALRLSRRRWPTATARPTAASRRSTTRGARTDGTRTTLTIAPGRDGDVRLPDGRELHNVVLRRATQPSSCTGVPAVTARAGLDGRLHVRRGRAPTAFVCGVHPDDDRARGRRAPTPDADADADHRPGGRPAPTPTPTPDADRRRHRRRRTTGPTTLELKLARQPEGTRVRGAVEVAQAGSRLEVTVTREPTRRRASCAASSRPRRHASRSRSGSTPRPARRCAAKRRLTRDRRGRADAARREDADPHARRPR